jgi:hypothetical protein
MRCGLPRNHGDRRTRTENLIQETHSDAGLAGGAFVESLYRWHIQCDVTGKCCQKDLVSAILQVLKCGIIQSRNYNAMQRIATLCRAGLSCFAEVKFYSFVIRLVHRSAARQLFCGLSAGFSISIEVSANDVRYPLPFAVRRR